MLETLELYLEYPFVINALIVGVMIALCSSLLGVTLVLKRFSLIGDGLAHVAFAALCVATVLHLVNKMLLTLPITILCAILILRGGYKIKGDAVIAMISVGSGIGLPRHEFIRCVSKFIGRCVRNAFRLHFDIDVDGARSLVERRIVGSDDCGVRSVLSQNFCGDV